MDVQEEKACKLEGKCAPKGQGCGSSPDLTLPSEELYELLSESYSSMPSNKRCVVVACVAALQAKEGKDEAATDHTYLKFLGHVPKNKKKRMEKVDVVKISKYIRNFNAKSKKPKFFVYVVPAKHGKAFKEMLAKFEQCG